MLGPQWSIGVLGRIRRNNSGIPPRIAHLLCAGDGKIDMIHVKRRADCVAHDRGKPQA
jgi:hypothetical protein